MTATTGTEATQTQATVEEFLGQVATDAAAVFHAAAVVLGDKLGLFRTLADQGAATPAELAARTEYDERYLQEWLHAQVAAGYCGHDPVTGGFGLSPAQATVLADESSPAFGAGMMALAASIVKDEERVGRDAFRTGAGVGWHEHHDDLFSGTGRRHQRDRSAVLLGRDVRLPGPRQVPGRPPPARAAGPRVHVAPAARRCRIHPLPPGHRDPPSTASSKPAP